MYAEIGKRLTTQCRFGTVIFTNAGKWSVSTAATDDDVLQPIPEHPDCVCCNINSNKYTILLILSTSILVNYIVLFSYQNFSMVAQFYHTL